MRAQHLSNSLTDASTSIMQLAALPPFQRHIEVAAMLSNEADLANTEILQSSADDAEDTVLTIILRASFGVCLIALSQLLV